MNVVKSLFSTRFHILNKKLFIINSCCKTPGSRNLYNVASLGVTAFQDKRENTLKSLQDQDEFKKKMEDYSNSDNSFLIFSDDVMKMLKIAQTDEDMLILLNMLKKFNQQNQSIVFHNFNFGPEIIRLYYVLNKPNDALELLRDEEMSWIFKTLASFIVLADMCFKNKMYKEVIEVFESFKDKQIQSKRFPYSLVTLFFASCYKINTEEIYETAINFWKDASNSGLQIGNREICFLSTLALNQNKSFVAVELLSSTRPTPLSNNIKVMALAKEKRFDEALSLLKDILFNDKPRIQFEIFVTNDTIEYVRSQLSDSDVEHIKKLEKIEKELTAHNFLKHEPLDQYLCQEIEYRKNKTNKRNTFF